MGHVDADNDSIDRWIVWWYRYDDTRRERRNTTVAAFDNWDEFERRIAELNTELRAMKAAGLAEEVERISGVHHPAGYRAGAKAERKRWRAMTRRGSGGRD